MRGAACGPGAPRTNSDPEVHLLVSSLAAGGAVPNMSLETGWRAVNPFEAFVGAVLGRAQEQPELKACSGIL